VITVIFAAAVMTLDAPSMKVVGVCNPPARTDETAIPDYYRLDSASFEWKRERFGGGNGLDRFNVTFPSPLVTETPQNNTVYCELFRPEGTKKVPCVIVLHIAGGDFPLARFMASSLANKGVAGLFIKLPYYGERRPPTGKARLISADLKRGLTGVRQAVLDLRRACDWIASQPDLDADRCGVMGVSLGAIVGGLASAIEPRLSHACLIMGAAELEHILYDSTERQAKALLKSWSEWGGTRELLRTMLRPIDVATYGDRLAKRNVLMFTALQDGTLPPKCGTALWNAAGKPRNVCYECGHYTMAWRLPWVLKQSMDFFAAWPAERLPAAGQGTK
jgi:cephalosporin-C deacetylase-like acetyl esterase